MGRSCRGICIRYKSPPIPYGLIYDLGHKRCTFCGIFIYTEDIRCPCCKAVLRTTPRNKINGKKKEPHNYIDNIKIILQVDQS